MINDSERQDIQSSANDKHGGQIETKGYSQLSSEQLGQRKIEFAPPHPEVKLTENAYKILKKRYLKKDENGEPAETPEQLFWRVARNVAEADRFYDFNADILSSAKEFYHAMTSLEFLPNSPTLMNAGRELQQLSACFVLPVGDSMGEIFTAIHNTAIIQKTGGGTGFSFSRLRPKGDMVKSTDGVASGPLSFIEVFNATTESVRQGGRRRGANMGILRIDHPDIVEFITAKRQPGRLTNFNISVALTNEFMRALENDEEYDLINPRNGEHVKKLKASTVFNMIVQNAWETGEPGIIFIDRIDEDNPTPSLGHIESTNPCGEQPLLPYESCVLGSINLGRMVKKSEEDKIEIDWDHLRKAVHLGVHFLDNVIDMNHYPIKEIEEMTKANRKIGLGVMGFADLLIQLGIPYDSKEAVETAQELMKFIQNESILASQEIAKTRGAFPNFGQSMYNVPGAPRIRNATCTTIAPTGTISMIAGCSSGIEPLFAVAYVKTVMDKDRLIEVNPRFVKAAKEHNFYSEELMEKVAEKGNLMEIAEVPNDVKRLFVTAHEITPEWHIRMQAAFQKYIHNSISKTTNFPRGATQDDVRHTYMLAWKLGCKGVTVYRDGSREGVISVGTKKREELTTVLKRPRPRPSVISGKTIRMSTGCGNLYVTVNEDENGPFEVFTQMGKSGGCAASQSEAVSRLISLALRSGIDPQVIIQQLQGIRCPSPRFQKEGVVLSCADAVSKALHAYFEMKKKGVDKQQQKQDLKNGAPMREMTPGERAELGNSAQCPECGTSLYFQEGCLVCPACGYSRCE